MDFDIYRSWILSFFISFTTGQTTSNGVCSSGFNQNDERCEIHHLKQEMVLQSAILQEMRSTFVTLDIKDCSDIMSLGHSTSGVYDIYQIGITQVYCDMETDGGGWTVILNRQNGDEDFHRTWFDYKHGFGDLSENNWLGNKYLFSMTSQRNYKLRIDLSDWEGGERHAVYSYFRVGSEVDKYQLNFNEYLASESNVGDSLSYHNGMYFSTKDRDNDGNIGHCARDNTSGGFWFKICHYAGLTNYYGYSPTGDYGKQPDDVITWNSWHGNHYSLKTAKMMIRPMN